MIHKNSTKDMQQVKELFILSPFEIPNIPLAIETIKAGANSILHLGRNKTEAKEALETLSKKMTESFGVCFTTETPVDIALPTNVDKIFYPFGMDISTKKNIEKYCQIHSIEEAEKAVKEGIKNIVLKGNEGAGKIAYESSFVLFQRIMNKYSDKNLNIYIQGGAGIHSSAAALALGAKGVIMDSQISLFAESRTPKELKDIFPKLSGGETAIVDNFRILLRNNSPKLPVNATFKNIKPLLGGLDISKNLIPVGQDVALAIDLFENYRNLKNLVAGFHEAVYSHLMQAKTNKSIAPNNKLAKDLNIKYPIAQGPMARVSDVPEFANEVANGGALPFIAMSMVTGEAAKDLITDTQRLLGGKTWGVGILGFLPAQIREEQTKYILEAKPPVVLIAGGRPSLATPFEKEGIKVFLHVPSPALLDMFLKEKAKNFIFEGRESGGHIGPLSSMVIWERQINRLLKEDDLSSISAFFAGGIHDAFSSAFVSIMTATLNAKGAKVGALMGSSYIYTKEIVKSGAIKSEFQQQAIDQDQTIILEAAPGQETRSLKSPFTDFFQEEKKRLQSQHSDSKEVWLRLEDLNLGRLRIAAKGIERIGTDLVKLNDKEQVEKGLYMMGQIASLHHKELTIAELHENVTVGNNQLLEKLESIPLPESNAKPLDVAIVGISGIFPDAKNIEEYWRNILLGRNCVTEVPDSRWNKDLYYNPDTRDTDYVSSKWGGFIPTIDFDPLEFGITPQSLASIEPTQLLSLLTAKRALSDAGYDNLDEIDLDNTSVIFGAEGATELAASYGFRGVAKQVFGEMPEEFKNALPRLNEDSFAGVLSNVISGRIANRLNLGGRNYTVDAACASSLAALDLGCQELASNRSNIVLLGGADLHNGITDFLMFSCTHALSRKGYSASFDSDSDGIALGEGIGVLVLKRLEDAERDGNKIYAVIKGVGGSSDGKSLGMTAPNRSGQVKALQRAYQSAGILPSQVEMIEAHGTGTVVGDRTELKALTDMFLESGAVKGQSLLGSVKTQIGHAKCAAGIAGVIKTALSLYYGVQPPTIHLKNPIPYYDNETSPFVFNTQPGLWNSERRIAGVSAFGFGGTNFHVVLENYKESNPLDTCMPLWPSELFVFRGDSLSEAKKSLKNVQEILENNDSVSIKDIAYTLAVQSSKDVQVSIVAGDTKELLVKIEAALADKKEFGVYFKEAVEGKMAFMFSGQGSQRVNMARDLFVAFPAMRKLLLENREYEEILFPHASFNEKTRKEQQKTITDTRNAQPLLGIVDLALAKFLRSLDIEPDMVAGHSYGELPALCFSGVFAEEELVYLSRERALSILNAVEKDSGKMMAVNIPEEELSALLKGETEVWAVNFNSHKQTVLAGSTNGLTAFMKKLSDKNIGYKELNVACAFHSPLLAKSKKLYMDVLKKVAFKEPTVPIWSNTTTELYPTTEKDIKTRLGDHLINPVLFTKQVENMYSDGARIFVEAGPGNVLTGLVQSILGDKVTTIETDNRAFNGVSFLLHAVAKIIATGKPVNVSKLFEKRKTTLLDLEDTAAFKKKPTIWFINGQNATPSNGKMPATGAYPIATPIMSVGCMGNMNNNLSAGSDQVVLEYLNNMHTMLQGQRDVMLGYLGYTPAPQDESARRTVQIPVTQETAAIQQPVVTAEATAVVAAGGPVNVSFEEVKELLLDIVSEKTGYPIDMLGLDLDLEADLSIDSIKRIEIIGALKDKLNITGSLEDSEDAIEKIASVKTLNGLIAWIKDLAEGNETGGQNVVMDAHAEVLTEELKTKGLPEKSGEVKTAEITRMNFELEEKRIDSSDKISIEGKKFALTNDGGKQSFASAIKKQLEAEGAIVDLIKGKESLTEYDGLIILNASKSPNSYDISSVFNLIKSADLTKMKWVYTFSDLLGNYKEDKDVADLKAIQGLSGLIKSLAFEYSDVNFRAVASYTLFDKKTLPQTVLDELSMKRSANVEIIYKDSKRYIINTSVKPLVAEGESQLSLTKDDVVLVFGGAQGITPELVSHLSTEYPCHYILIGRSEMPTDEFDKYAGLNSREDIRKYLISEEHMKSPAEIEKKTQKIFKAVQIKANIAKIEKTGAKVTYKSLDVKNEVALRAFIKDIYDAYGRIDGIIHAAGLLEDKLFSHKTLESFENVYSTKITPLRVLLDEIRPEIKMLVMFSSVASAFGNRGQSDYASANSVFDMVAPLLDERINAKVLTVNWGPWKGAGMVSSALEGEFEKRGISLIPLEDGAKYFVNELKYGKENHVLVMGGADDVKNFLNMMQ